MEKAQGGITTETQPIFDVDKARSMIAKGRRAKWWRRMGSKNRGFYYVDPNGSRVTDEQHLERIKSLVLPPAWKHVYVAPSAGSRLQAVGMDTTGRVQYKYHPTFTARRQKQKFARIEEFGKHLPRLRQITNEHIMLPGFPREKVLAVMIRLINSLYFRVGTEKSARHYRTYGITTLQNKHFRVERGCELVFDFVGKSHVQHRKILVDEELAAVMLEIKQLGRAGKLFHYLDEDGTPRPIKPHDINCYLKEVTAPEYSSKDFRTWGGTLLAAIRLAEIGCVEDERHTKKNLVRAIKGVAEDLGNTVAVCRSSYIHPAVITAYQKGMTIDNFRPKKQRRIQRREAEYEPEELALMKLLSAEI
ncbi:MAG: DNA topoisomerase IB [Pyrinomonadaceae bacterium]